MKKENIDKGRPKKGQIRVSEVLQWVCNNKDAYPLPQGYTVGEGGTLFYDIPALDVEMMRWCSISKMDFAEMHGVKPSQISRWISAGMPEREDGRLYYFQADEWVWDYKAECSKRRDSGWRD